MLGPGDVLPGVADVVTEVHVEAVFDDGSRLAVVADPIGGGSLGEDAPGAVLSGPGYPDPVPEVTLTVRNTASVPVSVTSHFHFFEANPGWTSTGPPDTAGGCACPRGRPCGSDRGRAPRCH